MGTFGLRVGVRLRVNDVVLRANVWYTPLEVNAMLHKSWKLTATGIDGNVKLFGVNIFECEWHSTGEKITVYDSSREADVYTVIIKGKERRFAAIERSYCVWEFYEYRW